MTGELLTKRADILRQEYQKAKQNVGTLTEQLELATNHLHVVTGHLNEVSFLMGEQQKGQDTITEQEHVDINDQDSE